MKKGQSMYMVNGEATSIVDWQAFYDKGSIIFYKKKFVHHVEKKYCSNEL